VSLKRFFEQGNLFGRMRVAFINVAEYHLTSCWHTLTGLQMYGYLTDRSKACALLRVLFMICLRLSFRSTVPASRQYWLHVAVALLSTLTVVHVIGANVAPVMIHFLTGDGSAALRFVQIVGDASIGWFVFWKMIPIIRAEEENKVGLGV
jgi:hypothetical protein